MSEENTGFSAESNVTSISDKATHYLNLSVLLKDKEGNEVVRRVKSGIMLGGKHERALSKLLLKKFGVDPEMEVKLVGTINSADPVELDDELELA